MGNIAGKLPNGLFTWIHLSQLDSLLQDMISKINASPVPLKFFEQFSSSTLNHMALSSEAARYAVSGTCEGPTELE